MDPIKIIIADDHQLFREGLKSILDQDGIQVISEANSGSDLITKLKDQQPDVILLDIDMPDINGIEATKIIKKQYPRLNILILSSFVHHKQILEVIQAGASGFIIKNTGKDELFNAIRAIACGDSYFSKEVSKKLTYQLININPEENDEDPSAAKLSEREKDILKLISQGFTNSEIAEKLFISTHTVVTHRRNLLQKINAKNTAGLVRYASQHGLL
ncbi:MAG: response regulator [Candidatus Cyclobacteriaceae bacterium M3_2C_046]